MKTKPSTHTETARKKANRLKREAGRRAFLARCEAENTLPWPPDICWFDKHPDREWRLRPASEREVFQHIRLVNHDQPIALDPGCAWMKLIRRWGSKEDDQFGCWATIPLCGQNAIDDDVDDTAIAGLYEELFPRRRRHPCEACDAEGAPT